MKEAPKPTIEGLLATCGVLMKMVLELTLDVQALRFLLEQRGSQHGSFSHEDFTKMRGYVEKESKAATTTMLPAAVTDEYFRELLEKHEGAEQ